MRVHLFEWEDQSWFPVFIRDGLTDFLTFMAKAGGAAYAPLSTRIAAAMTRLGTDTLVELAAGGGGPGIVIAGHIEKATGRRPRVLLTDLYPNVTRLRLAKSESPGEVVVVERSVNAADVPTDLQGFRVMCNSFHHLGPELALSCLRDAVTKKQGIAIGELVSRSPLGFLQVFVGVIVLLVATPFVKPFRVSRLVFTYVIPLLPIFTLWDGIVSCLRVYSPRELKELVAKIPSSGYEWEIGLLPLPGAPSKMTYLIGFPSK